MLSLGFYSLLLYIFFFFSFDSPQGIGSVVRMMRLERLEEKLLANIFMWVRCSGFQRCMQMRTSMPAWLSLFPPPSFFIPGTHCGL